MTTEQKEKKEHQSSPIEKQVTPLSSEVDPKDTFLRTRQFALRHAAEIKNKPFRK